MLQRVQQCEGAEESPFLIDGDFSCIMMHFILWLWKPDVMKGTKKGLLSGWGKPWLTRWANVRGLSTCFSMGGWSYPTTARSAAFAHSPLAIAKGHVVAEPASCMGVACAMAGALPIGPEDKVAFVLSGGNNDLTLLARILSE